MTHIYRVENSEGIGPYLGTDEDDWKAYVHCKETGHPGPFDDIPGWGKVAYSSQFKFGFQSKAQLDKWFSRCELQILIEKGFRVVTIPITEVDEIMVGSHQVAFTRKNKAMS